VLAYTNSDKLGGSRASPACASLNLLPDRRGLPLWSPVKTYCAAMSGQDPTITIQPEVDATPSGAPAQRFSLGNRPALTGIRAFLVFPVVIFHTNFETLPGSWATLDTFFVLSGFLITSLLAIEQQRTNRISLGKFYSRRAVRLLPPLFLTVALLAVYAALVNVANASQRIWGDSAAALFYYADYRQAFESNPLYGGFLTQCWSLAVEEQFYLIWAVLLVVALKFGYRRLGYAMAIAGIAICTANRLYIVLSAPHWNIYVADRTYYSFDTRGDALFIGCLLGLIATGNHLENWNLTAKRLLIVAAVASTGVMIWIFLNIHLYSRWLPLVWVPVSELASVIIIMFFIIHPGGVGAKLMGISFLVLLGNMSYTIYLLHWPVFVALSPSTTHWSYWLLDTVRMVIVMTLALACWYVMEKPLTKWRRRELDPTHSSQAAVAQR
jgi:peptidoglycan/LPS O-acetylase OafA/YrhL